MIYIVYRQGPNGWEQAGETSDIDMAARMVRDLRAAGFACSVFNLYMD